MRRFIAVGITLGLAVAILAPMWSVGQAAPAGQRGEESSCTAYDPATGAPLSSRSIIPSTIRLCETAEVSLTVRATCAAVPLHVVLNIDVSGSMIGQPMEDAKAAAIALVQTLDLDNHEDTQVGLVSHGMQPRIESQLTNNAGQIVGRIRRMQAAGEDNLPAAIDQSRLMLIRGRQNMPIAPFDVMVILSDGGQTVPVQRAVSAANAAKGADILVVAVCLENPASHCNEMRQMATTTQYFFQERNTGQLTRIFRQIADELRSINLRMLTVEETLPDDLEFVPGSFMPTPSHTQGDTMRWDYRFVSESGEIIRYRVQPQTVVTYPVAVSKLSFTDSQDRRGSGVVPTAVLTVSMVCPAQVTPTPTAEPATVTPTPVPPTPTGTPTATPTRTPTPVPPTPVPQPVFLPILNLNRCVERDRPADVVLVIDASTSMGADTKRERTKLEAAREGAKQFVDLMRRVDQTAVLAFNEHPQLMVGLTDDRLALHEAIDAIQMAPWTRIDLALEGAAVELASERRRNGSMAVIVLLTDGLPSRTTADAVRAAAESARAPGTTIFTIGVGRDVDRQLLIDVAGDKERFYAAADAEALAAIYRQISVKIPCP